jgi:hypothetical protein
MIVLFEKLKGRHQIRRLVIEGMILMVKSSLNGTGGAGRA